LSLWDDTPVNPAAIKSRATMTEVIKFTAHNLYDFVVVENVVEVTKWEFFNDWYREMTQILGYKCDTLCFNSMFFWPTPQSRDRIYFVFRRNDVKAPNLNFTPPAWCEKCERDIDAVQAWKKQSALKRVGKYRQQYVYRCPRCASEVTPYYFCAYNVIDWSQKAQRIGDRKKPLAAKTLARIELGLKKFGPQPFVTLPNTRAAKAELGTKDLQSALPTQTATARFALTVPIPQQPLLMQTEYTHATNDRTSLLTQPHPAQTTRPAIALVTPPASQVEPFILEHLFEYRPSSLTESLSTVVAGGNHHSLVQPPSSTPITAREATPVPFIVEMYGNGIGRNISQPLSTVTANGNHHGLVEVTSTAAKAALPGSTDKFLLSYYGTDTCHELSEAIPTIPTHDRHALVGTGKNIESDDQTHRLPISVMDCTFRMLRVEEIGKAMGFPKTYKTFGSNKDKIKLYGNAVTPPVMHWIIGRCVEALA
jgi:DNA (cytosine-5)-methyltransferase 1